MPADTCPFLPIAEARGFLATSDEWGYASRVADVANFISEYERGGLRPEHARVVEREQVEQALHSLWL